MVLTNRWSVIKIWEPKYSTNEVLIKTDRVTERNRIEIEKGAFAGEYFIAGDVAKSYPIKPILNKRGKYTNMYQVPISQLERI